MRGEEGEMTAASRMRPRASVGWRGRMRSRVEEGGSERGAVLVEAALVFPLFLLLLFGLIEFGFIFKDTQTIDNMTRAGVLRVPSPGDSTDPDADYQILTSILGASFGITPKEVIIFDATSLKGSNPGNVPSGMRRRNVPVQHLYSDGSGHRPGKPKAVDGVRRWR